MNHYEEFHKAMQEASKYYTNSIIVTEKTFTKMNIKSNLTTVQKILIFKFLTNLNNTELCQTL